MSTNIVEIIQMYSDEVGDIQIDYQRDIIEIDEKIKLTKEVTERYEQKLQKVIAEAQLEAIERYESLYDCTFRADYECGENVQTGKSFIAQKSYLAELRKAAGKGE